MLGGSLRRDEVPLAIKAGMYYMGKIINKQEKTITYATLNLFWILQKPKEIDHFN